MAKGSERAGSDIDLLIVTDRLAYADVYSALAAAEQTLGRTINPTVFTQAEWKKKRTRHDSFSARITAQPRLFVIGVTMAQIKALEKLASTGVLKHEPPGGEEIAGLLRMAAVRLEDARKTTNVPESRFDLAYNAAHAFALAALRIHGYRTEKSTSSSRRCRTRSASTRRHGGYSIAVIANGTRPSTGDRIGG